MKILVFGAGVLGCNLANDLFRGGKDVTLLARGAWGQELQENGLRIKSAIFPHTTVSPIPVTGALTPEDDYDAVFVAVRYTQIEGVLDTLRACKAKYIIFLVNNVRAPEVAAQLPEKTVLFAFASSAGHREATRVVSAPAPAARYPMSPTWRTTCSPTPLSSSRWSSPATKQTAT